MSLKRKLGSSVNRIIKPLGYKISSLQNTSSLQHVDWNWTIPVEASEKERRLIQLTLQFSMSTPIRIWALIQSLKHIFNQNLAGDLVECGVWKGANLVVMRKYADSYFPQKTVYGYDTFEGMNEPTDIDVDFLGNKASEVMQKSPRDESITNIHAIAGIDTVKKNLEIYEATDKIILVKGKVEDTLTDANNLPGKIAVLRLDTDWYESTRVELENLYPRLVKGGVLIIDDYGHFQGARKAVDDFFSGENVWMHYVDYTCRLIIK